MDSRILGLLSWLVLSLAGCPTTSDTVPVEASSDSSGLGDSSESGGSGGTVSVDSSSGDPDTGGSSGSESSGGDPVCGNGVVEGGEQCDDEGESALCNVDCTPAMCGDGLVNETATEDCDDGGESATCDDDCTPAECGDGVLNATATEDCDDGGESANCDVDCTVPICGDDVFNVSAGEECDGSGRTAACNLDCTLATCGDGVFNVTAGEECDDGGESVSCDSDCTIASCGDGVFNMSAGEQCDDMGESLGCDPDCSLSACGDGFVNTTAGEDCEEMGETANCDADCTSVMCGDDLANATAGEQCDGVDVLGITCEDEGFTGGGTLACDGLCMLDTTGCSSGPAAPVLQLGFSAIKQFDFSWAPAAGADYYQLEESSEPGELFVQLGGDIMGLTVSRTMSLHYRRQASYRLWACNIDGCTASAVVNVMDSLASAVGYFKASNTDSFDSFGSGVALSADGNTLAVGALQEGSSATGVDGNQANNGTSSSGAVYVFVQDGTGQWIQQAYIKASNTGMTDFFGRRLALSSDGNTLAVSASREDSIATGIDGDQASNAAGDSGAVYVFVRDGMGAWSQQAYVKASNTDPNDRFGEFHGLALSADGNTLAVGARYERSNATGIDGDQANNASINSGAVYVFVRDGMGAWSQQAYVKASNTGVADEFGYSVALDEDGDTLAVGASREESNATGIDGNQGNNADLLAGAVYMFTRDGMGQWSQQAYVKASNTDGGDRFGASVALDADGDTLAVGATGEQSSATGIDGDQASNAAPNSGAVYVFTRDGMSQWSQQTYVKASNTGGGDSFGHHVALSGDGSTLVASSIYEDSSAIGLDGDQASNATSSSGAVYVFTLDGMGQWSQRAYVKASNPDPDDQFGAVVSLSANGNALAISAAYEESNATGIDGDQLSNAANNSGAVYLY